MQDRKIIRPDGRKIVFPSGTSDEEIQSVMLGLDQEEADAAKRQKDDPRSIQQQQLANIGITREQAVEQGMLQEEIPRNFQPVPEAETNRLSAMGAGIERGFKGIGTGFLQAGAEMASLAGADNEPLQAELARQAENQRIEYEARTANYPKEGFSGEVMGNMAALPLPATNSVKGIMGLGGLMGSLQPTETTDGGDRALNTVAGSAISLGGAGALRLLQSIPTAFSSFMRDNEIVANSPTVDRLKQRVGQLYSAAERSGLNFGKRRYRQFALDIRKKVADQYGVNGRLNPKLVGKGNDILDEVDAVIGSNPSFRQLDQLRRVANIGVTSADPTEQAIGRIIRDGIDTFVEAGGGLTGKIADKARNLWGRVKRDDMVANAITRAGYNNTGVEQGLRVQFRQILINPRKRMQFSEVEQAIMGEIVNGSKTQNMLRAVGKLGFDINRGVPNVVGGLGGGAVVAAGGGSAPMIAAQQGVSVASRRVSESMAERKAGILQAFIRSSKPELEVNRLRTMLERAGDDKYMVNIIARSLGMEADEVTKEYNLTGNQR